MWERAREGARGGAGKRARERARESEGEKGESEQCFVHTRALTCTHTMRACTHTHPIYTLNGCILYIRSTVASSHSCTLHLDTVGRSLLFFFIRSLFSPYALLFIRFFFHMQVAPQPSQPRSQDHYLESSTSPARNFFIKKNKKN